MGTTKRSASSLANRSATTLKALDFPTPPGPQSNTCVASVCSSTQGQLVINLLEVGMLYDNVLKGIQSCSVLGFELCHVSDTPLTLEGWSNQAHRPSRSRRCPVRAESSSIGQQLLREWTRPPDRAVVGRAALLRSEPLPETPPASNCQWSPACGDGPVAVRAIQRG